MSTLLIDRDPDDESFPRHEASPETGLCARPWCDDAALPGEEFCRDCLVDILMQEAELG